jgi:D-alanyl-D-alanine carboxypeptidase
VYRYPTEDASVAVVTNGLVDEHVIGMGIALALMRSLYPRFIDG